jgi:hypothetical protein
LVTVSYAAGYDGRPWSHSSMMHVFWSKQGNHPCFCLRHRPQRAGLVANNAMIDLEVSRHEIYANAYVGRPCERIRVLKSSLEKSLRWSLSVTSRRSSSNCVVASQFCGLRGKIRLHDKGSANNICILRQNRN